jgi:hypothetical protein
VKGRHPDRVSLSPEPGGCSPSTQIERTMDHIGQPCSYYKVQPLFNPSRAPRKGSGSMAHELISAFSVQTDQLAAGDEQHQA